MLYMVVNDGTEIQEFDEKDVEDKSFCYTTPMEAWDMWLQEVEEEYLFQKELYEKSLTMTLPKVKRIYKSYYQY